MTDLLEKLVRPGVKVELHSVSKEVAEDGTEIRKVYQSKVCDVRSEDSIEIYMPMEKTRLILLQPGSEYDMFFYVPGGMYQCGIRIKDRYKNGNVYLLLLEIISEIRKHQRREYYRLSCAIDMLTRTLEKEEKKAIEEGRIDDIGEKTPMSKSIIADISGGGLRFVSRERYEEGDYIYCKYALANEYGVLAKVLSSSEIENRSGEFEHRVEYVRIDLNIREEIIRYIFEQERKSRQRGREDI